MFSKEFLFGAASAAYQIEGAWNEDGKGLSNWDVFSKINGKTFEGTNGDVAVDHYHRYKEDVKLMAEMGLESYRFSISWSRIIPNGTGEINQKGIDFYNDLIDELLKYNIKPFVTLYHWDLPNILEEKGGWDNKETVNAYLEYAKVCFENFSDRVNHWITFNEAIVFCGLGYILEAHPPALNNHKKYYQATHNVFYAHALAVNYFDEHYKTKKTEIGISHVLSPIYPGDTTKESFESAKCEEQQIFDWYYDPTLKGEYPQDLLKYVMDKFEIEITNKEMDAIRCAAKKVNFIGVNYYQPKRIIKNKQNLEDKTSDLSHRGGSDSISWDQKTRSISIPEGKYTPWNWEINPGALYDGLKQIYDTYNGIPIYITENGLGNEDHMNENHVINDVDRIEYVEAHLKEVNRAIINGINVKGYYMWSFTDLLSWLNGYKKQYGFIYIDHNDNLKRYKKDSYYWYQKMIKSRGKNLI